MRVRTLKYDNKEQALQHLIDLGVYVEVEHEEEITLQRGEGVSGVKLIPSIVLEQPTYDENGEELTAPVYAEGYHANVLCNDSYDFGEFEIEVVSPKYRFAGW